MFWHAWRKLEVVEFRGNLDADGHALVFQLEARLHAALPPLKTVRFFVPDRASGYRYQKTSLRWKMRNYVVD